MKRAMNALGLLLALGVAALLFLQDGRREVPAKPAAGRQSETTGPLLEGAGHVTDPSLLWSLVVTVWDVEASAPLANEAVEIEFRTTDSPRYARVTDGRGHVRFGPYSSPFLTKGLYIHVACAAREASTGLIEALPAEDGVRELRVTAQIVRSGAVEGRVLLPSGVPAEAARLFVRWPDGPLIDHHGSVSGAEAVPLVAGGRFRKLIDEDRPLEWLVAVAHEGRRWFGRAVTSGAKFERVEIALSDLRPGDIAFMRMHVRTPDGKAAPANFWDRWIRGDLQSCGISTNQDIEDNHLRWFQWQPGGELYVQIEHARSDDFGHVALGPLSVDLTDVEVTLPPARVLRGTVRTASGQPVAGTKVGAHMIQFTRSGRDLGWMDEGATTNESGAYEIRGLGHIPYVITVSAEASLGTTRPQEVSAEQDTLDFVVRPASSAKLRVLDAAGAPVVGARVSVDLPPRGVRLDPDLLPVADWSVSGEFEDVALGVMSAEDGGVVIDGLDDGRLYRVVIYPPADRPGLGDIEVQGWRPHDTDFRLPQPQGALISGRILSAAGEPRGQRYVYARHVDGSDAGGRRYRLQHGGEFFDGPSEWAGKDGRFALGPLPVGKYELHAGGGVERVVAAAGATDVVLRVEGDEKEPYALQFRVANLPFDDRGVWAVLSIGDGYPKRMQVDPAGVVQFTHVSHFRRCALWIGGLAGGRYVWAQDLAPPPEDDWAPIEVEIETGSTLRGRIVPPPGVRLDEWSVEPIAPVLRRDLSGGVTGGLPCRADTAGLTFDVSGVPPGAWTVRVMGRSGTVTYRGEAKGTPGDEVVVVLK